MNKDNQDKLFRLGPELFCPEEDLVSWAFDVGDGWYSIIEDFLMKLKNLNNGKRPTYMIFSFKEKFGGLRAQVFGDVPDEVYDLATELTKTSQSVCESCGSTTNVQRSLGGWIYTRCKECASKMNEGRSVLIEWTPIK